MTTSTATRAGADKACPLALPRLPPTESPNLETVLEACQCCNCCPVGMASSWHRMASSRHALYIAFAFCASVLLSVSTCQYPINMCALVHCCDCCARNAKRRRRPLHGLPAPLLALELCLENVPSAIASSRSPLPTAALGLQSFASMHCSKHGPAWRSRLLGHWRNMRRPEASCWPSGRNAMLALLAALATWGTS